MLSCGAHCAEDRWGVAGAAAAFSRFGEMRSKRFTLEGLLQLADDSLALLQTDYDQLCKDGLAGHHLCHSVSYASLCMGNHDALKTLAEVFEVTEESLRKRVLHSLNKHLPEQRTLESCTAVHHNITTTQHRQIIKFFQGKEAKYPDLIDTANNPGVQVRRVEGNDDGQV